VRPAHTPTKKLLLKYLNSGELLDWLMDADKGENNGNKIIIGT